MLIRRDGDALDAEHPAHARMRVVRVGAVGDPFARMRLAGGPERLEIGDRAARGEVAEVVGEAEHARETGDDLLLHPRRGWPAVEGMVVGIDEHGGDVAEDCRGMRGLEHLADVARMPEGVVVGQPLLQAGERRGEHRIVHDGRRVRRELAELRHPPLVRLDGARQPGGEVRHGWQG